MPPPSADSFFAGEPSTFVLAVRPYKIYLRRRHKPESPIHDLKRTQGDYYRLTDQNGLTGDGLVDGFAYDADELVYPIPDREINVNPKLTQNSGY